jgi:hypothetical protein
MVLLKKLLIAPRLQPGDKRIAPWLQPGDNKEMAAEKNSSIEFLLMLNFRFHQFNFISQ